MIDANPFNDRLSDDIKNRGHKKRRELLHAFDIIDSGFYLFINEKSIAALIL